MYSTLKQRENIRFHVVSMWNTGGVFLMFDKNPQLVEVIKQAIIFQMPQICSILIVFNATSHFQCLNFSVDCHKLFDFPIIFRVLDNLDESEIINQLIWKLIDDIANLMGKMKQLNSSGNRVPKLKRMVWEQGLEEGQIGIHF